MIDEYYDSIAKGYDKLHKAEQEKKVFILLSKIKVSSKDKLLDVGCGTGLSTTSWNCIRVGVDSSKELLDLAHLKNEVKYMLGKAEDLPFENSSFDVVISVTAIQNFLDVKKGLEEIKRVGKQSFGLTFLKNSEKKDLIEKIINELFVVKEIIEEDKDLIFLCEKQ